MPYEPGSTLGPYVLQAQIGAGGMGVVFRARDPKLDRMVAIKVLPASLAEDPVRVARFEREAKAVAALSHPNVLGIFDFGRDKGTSYAVMELLEGENLRERLRGGPLPLRKALEIATQVALGLGAAHSKGILHRDIKPENIFICKDGQVKVLDFGLAKPMPKWEPSGAGLDEALTAAAPLRDHAPGKAPERREDHTRAGMLVGTVGYMSPEQVRGEELDARSDIFSFGSVLFELLTGQRAFRRDSHDLTIDAILQEEPPGFQAAREPLPPMLENIVAHCLEKRPEARFQSMRDIAFALQHLETGTLGGAAAAREGRRPRPRRALAVAAAAALLAVVGFLAVPALRRERPAPAFHRVNLAEGTLESAFFGPDGATLYLCGRVQGRAPEVFVLHPDSVAPEAIGLQDALLLGVSAGSDLAVLRHPSRRFGGRYSGTLAQVPGAGPASGGAVKDVLEDVCDAAWDGRSMALLLQDDAGLLRLEFPSGRTVLKEDAGSSGLKCLRLAPAGDRLAYIRNDSNAGRSFVETVDRDGRRRTLFAKEGDSLAQTLTGLAWGPGGRLWCSEWEGDQTTLWAMDGRGGRRLLWRGEGSKQLLDVSPAGRALMATQRVRRGVFLQKDGATREISILGGTQAAGLSADGTTLLLLESPALDGGTSQDQAYVYRPQDPAPVKLARGNPLSLTPDGRVLNLALDFMGIKDLDSGATAAFQLAGLDPAALLGPSHDGASFLYFVPIGAGRPRVLRLPERFQGHGIAYLAGDMVVFQGQEKDRLAWYRWVPGKGEPEAFTPEGLGTMAAGLTPLSPDFSRMVATGNGKDWFIVPLRGGGQPQPIRGLARGERIVGWCEDGRHLFVRPELSVLPVAIARLDPDTGSRARVLDFTPPDPAGHLQIRSVFLTPDARTAAFTYDRKLSELFLVDDLRP
jgi:tRNA A-37 threonylcarbamoyl transferase component Bud32